MPIFFAILAFAFGFGRGRIIWIVEVRWLSVLYAELERYLFMDKDLGISRGLVGGGVLFDEREEKRRDDCLNVA